MHAPLLRAAFALLLFAPALAALAADKDAYGDPLPEGAKARLGTARLRSTTYNAPVLAPDGKTLYAAGPDGLALVDPVTGARTGKVPGQPPGNLVALSADGTRAVNNTYDGFAVWDTASGKTLSKQARRVGGGESAFALSADGKRLAFGVPGDRMKKEFPRAVVWNVDADKEVASVTVPQNESTQVALSPDGTTLANWGYHYAPNSTPADEEKNPGRFVVFWDVATGKELSRFRGAGYVPQAVAFGPKGLVAVSAGNNVVDLVDPKTGGSKHQLLGRTGMGAFLTFSPDGATVVAAAGDGAVQLWRADTGARIATVEPPIRGAYNTRVRMLSADKGLAWAVKGLAAFVWEVPSGKPLGPTEGHTSTVSSVAVTADGNHVLTSADSGGVLRWELATGKLVGEVAFKYPNAPSPGYAPAASFSADGTRALVRESFTSVAVFDVASGTQWYTIPTPNNVLSRESFSADGSKVVLVRTPNDDTKKQPARVTVLDTTTGVRLGEIELPGYSRLAAAVTPDGKHLVTVGVRPGGKGANDASVVTGWELATGAKKGELTGKSQYYLPQVVAGPDNTTAAVGTGDGKVFAFDFLEGKQLRAFDLKGGHNAPLVLSPDGKRLAVAGQPTFGRGAASPVVVFDWASGDVVKTLSVPGTTPQAMAFAPDGNTLVTSAPDTTATVWDVGK